MSALVVDTSIFITYFNDGPDWPLFEEALAEGRIFVPPVVVSELLSSPKLSSKERADLSSFLKDLPLCESEYEHWAAVGNFRADLLRAGLSVSTPDTHVLQCAIDRGAPLVSEDAIFKKVLATRLRRFEVWESEKLK